MILHVKFMVCYRCKLMVIEELKKLGIRYSTVELGMIETQDSITLEQMEALKSGLHSLELELIEDKKSVLVEKIKGIIIKSIHYSDAPPKQNYSDFISEELGYDYAYLSHMFSEVKGTTIQQFVALHRVERVKELINYDELTLSEIAYKLSYSSLAHLSKQFKKHTGFSPSCYKQLEYKSKKSLVEV